MRTGVLVSIGVLLALPLAASADVVTDWNSTLRTVMQNEGTMNVSPLSNPGWATRTIAMLNGAIYDSFQAINRTHQPFLVNMSRPSASREAAAAQAAYDILADCYPSSAHTSLIQNALTGPTGTLTRIPDGPSKAEGIMLGHTIAQQYLAAREHDGSDVLAPWPEGTLPGEWRSDPLHAPQEAWGPKWGVVAPFVPGSNQSSLPGVPALDSEEYTAAYEQVKSLGALNSTARSAEQTEIGLFWAYDRAGMGPPPVLFVSALEDIAHAVGNSPEENARLFALASVSMADAAVAAWSVKFDENFWRPISGIREGDRDGNIATVGDPHWVPLGAPGNDPESSADDFTPPFPSYTSGHATMGGALFKSLELFYGTNRFEEADALVGDDAIDMEYMLTSQEAGSGNQRMYREFTENDIAALLPGMETTPEGENATSRIYLGIHWWFDQRDGTILGNDVASFVHANHFRSVPEPASGLMAAVVAVVLHARRHRRLT